MSTVALGCDPGSKRSALVALTPDGNSRWRVVSAELVDNRLASLRDWLLAVRGHGAVVAMGIEEARGGARAFAVKHLLPTMRAFGAIEALAWTLGYPRMAITATAWRASVLGPRPPAGASAPKSRPWDSHVLAGLPRHLANMPSGHGHDAGHLRDACGVALAAARLAGLPVLPAPVPIKPPKQTRTRRTAA